MARQRLTDRSLNRKPPPAMVELWDTLLPAFGVRLHSGGRRTFFVMGRFRGKQRRYKIGIYPATSLAEARSRARDLLQDLARGRDPKKREALERREEQRRQANNFAAVAEAFLEEYVRAKQLRSAANIESQITHVLIPAWGDRPIADITRADIKELLRTTRRKKGKGQNRRGGPTAANRLLATISKLFNWALDEEIVQTSPAVRLTPPAPEVERDRILGDDEIKAIWNAAGKMGFPFGSMIKLLFLTGQRRSEVARMCWSEVDVDAAAWTIPGARAKSGRGHLVPLSPAALKILGEAPETGEYVFSSGRAGDRPVSGFSRAKRRCTRLSGLVEDWRLHDIRRSVATGLRSLGFDRLTVSKILNHAESGVTRIYDRFADDAGKRRALDEWAMHVEAVVSGELAPSNVVEMNRSR